MENLIKVLRSLPGVGSRMAERIGFHVFKMSPGEIERLISVIREVKNKIHYCSRCFNITEDEICSICRNPQRDKTVLCVVERTHDISAIEKGGGYKGIYHVLMGALSPLEAIGPDDLKITDLIKRIQTEQISEVIIATNPNVTGEATAVYLSELIKPLGVKVTRLAQGISIGSALEYTDARTLAKSIEGRREM